MPFRLQAEPRDMDGGSPRLRCIALCGPWAMIESASFSDGPGLASAAAVASREIPASDVGRLHTTLFDSVTQAPAMSAGAATSAFPDPFASRCHVQATEQPTPRHPSKSPLEPQSSTRLLRCLPISGRFSRSAWTQVSWKAFGSRSGSQIITIVVIVIITIPVVTVTTLL